MAIEDFDKADIILGKRLAEHISGNQFKLGELADRIEKKYGDDTLGEFAEVIGIDYNTLKSYRYVHRKWKASAVKPKNFSVARSLANYKDKDQYIKSHPNVTERQARKDIRKIRQDAKDTKEVAAEKKGMRLGNWSKAAEKLIADIEKHALDKWQHKLELLSQRRKGINLGTVADLIMILDRTANMLHKYEEILKAANRIVEVEHKNEDHPIQH